VLHTMHMRGSPRAFMPYASLGLCQWLCWSPHATEARPWLMPTFEHDSSSIERLYWTFVAYERCYALGMASTRLQQYSTVQHMLACARMQYSMC
jgi:hypothetical protein